MVLSPGLDTFTWEGLFETRLMMNPDRTRFLPEIVIIGGAHNGIIRDKSSDGTKPTIFERLVWIDLILLNLGVILPLKDVS